MLHAVTVVGPIRGRDSVAILAREAPDREGGLTTYWAPERAPLWDPAGTGPLGTLVTKPVGDGVPHLSPNRGSASLLRVWRTRRRRCHGHGRRRRA